MTVSFSSEGIRLGLAGGFRVGIDPQLPPPLEARYQVALRTDNLPQALLKFPEQVFHRPDDLGRLGLQAARDRRPGRPSAPSSMLASPAPRMGALPWRAASGRAEGSPRWAADGRDGPRGVNRGAERRLVAAAGG
jgi:hypothetical protein